MKQLTIAAVLVCLLAACTPAAPPASEQASTEALPVPDVDPSAVDPLANSDTPSLTWAQAANDRFIAGEWRYEIQPDGSGALAAYRAQGFTLFTMVCSGLNQVLLISDIELAPDQPTGFGIVTPTARYVFAAQSQGSGTDFPQIAADVDMNDPRLDAIAASTESFAYQVAGYSTRISGDPMLARVLQECRT